MKKRLSFAGVLAVWMVLGTWAFSQSMRGPQTSFPIQGSGLRIFPTIALTFAPTHPSYRIAYPSPTPLRRPRFFPLTPTVKSTSLRGIKLKTIFPTPIGRPRSFPLTPTVEASSPREIKLKTTFPDGAVSVMGPRQVHYKSLYQDPTPVNQP